MTDFPVSDEMIGQRETDWQAEQTLPSAYKQLKKAKVLESLRHLPTNNNPDHHSFDSLKET